MPNDSNYANYAVDSGANLYSVVLSNTSTTESYVKCYTGYYTGGQPVVLGAGAFDVARDLSTGNLWQYTGSAWIPASWNSAITFFLGGATTVCERLKSPATAIPNNVQVYTGTDDEVPAELALNDDDVAIHHGIGNYNVQVKVFRTDAVSDTIVDVPFPEGYIISTDDGDWTILKNFNTYAGFDYCTVSLIWTAVGGDSTPQVQEYVTSSGLELALSLYPTSSVVEEMISSGGGAVAISGGNGINVVTSGGSSVVELSGSAVFSDAYNSTTLSADSRAVSFGAIDVNGNHISAGLTVQGSEGIAIGWKDSDGGLSAGLRVNGGIDGGYLSFYATADDPEHTNPINFDSPVPPAWNDQPLLTAETVSSMALVSGAAFVTTVGDYTLALTSDGIIASGTSGECVVLSGGTAKLMNNYDDVEQYVAVEHASGVSIHAADPGRNVDIVCDAGDINLNTSYGGAVKINDVPVITQLIRAVDSSFNTSAQVRVSGGTHYIYPNALDQLIVGVAEDSRESYVQFTLTSSGTLIVPSTLALLNSGIEFDGGKTYLLGFLNGMMAASELTEGTGSYGSFAVKFWDTGNIYDFSVFSGDFYNQYYLCAALPGYSIVINQHDDDGENTQGRFYGPDGTLLSSGEGAGNDIATIGWDSEDYSIQYTAPAVPYDPEG